MTFEELEKELAEKWEPMLQDLQEFFDAINEKLRGEKNATDKEER